MFASWSALVGLSAPSLAFLLACAFLAGLARGFSGFGAALIFVPLASTTLGPQMAAPLLLLIDGVMSLGLIPNAWRKAERREVAIMAIGALLGVPIGTWLLAHSDPTAIRWGISVLCLSLLGLLISGWRYRNRPAPTLTAGVGAVAGFFSGVAQVGGPPVVAYCLGRAAKAPAAVRADIVIYFAFSTVLTAITYVAGGLLGATVLALGLLTGPAYGIGLFTGARLFGLASETAFRRLCYGLIGAATLLSLPVFDGVLR